MTPPDSLVIPLAGLLSDPPGSTRRADLADVTFALDDGFTLAVPLRGSVEIVRTNRGVLVDARFQTALTTECSRCLGPALIPVSIDIREEVLPSIDLATGKATDQTAEPEVSRLNDHHELDLEPLLRDAVTLAEPIAPLCRPDCPGLCVLCGAPLGDAHADHDADEIDPRLAALRTFRVDADAENE
ncbi:MAG TPA: DUF177 domain-containing protein [Candidatus Limnocylindrales bacterium]|nr:DUF177 domain-containing protein [Candidatus Limnocylindrales bacterium]